MATRDPSASRRPTRRDFLKVSAAGTAVLGGLSMARGAHAAGKDTIKIGMIGCGGRCSGAASQALQAGADVKLVAMCDLFEDRLRASHAALKKEHPEQVAVDEDHRFIGFDGYQKVIDSVDVVLIACASKFHPMYAEAAIKAGKHVFVEKPHAIDPVGIRRMEAVCDLAEQKHLSLLSGLQSRFDVGWQETIKRIHDGAIGDVVAMQSMFLRGPYRLVKRDPNLTEMEYQCSNWYHFRWLSGDDVPQSLVHNVDRMSWIMNEEMPAWAFGLGGRSSSFGEVFGDMFDHHTVVYEYKNGARLYALCRTAVGCYNNAGDIIMGTKGQCNLARCQIRGETDWSYRGERNNPYLAEQRALIDSVRNNKPINSGYHMIGSTRIGILGQITCYTGKSTTWEAARDADLCYKPTPEEASFEIEPPIKPGPDGNYPLPMPGVSTLL